MKKMKSLIGLFASCFAIVLALAVWAGINPPVSVSASSYDSWSGGAYDYEIEEYETELNISSKRVVSVKERITANFTETTLMESFVIFRSAGALFTAIFPRNAKTPGTFHPIFKRMISIFFPII